MKQPVVRRRLLALALHAQHEVHRDLVVRRVVEEQLHGAPRLRPLAAQHARVGLELRSRGELVHRLQAFQRLLVPVRVRCTWCVCVCVCVCACEIQMV